MIKEYIKKISEFKDLSAEECFEIVDYLAEDSATPAQIGAFLTALKLKGETAEEIFGFAKRMRELAVQIDLQDEILVDSCGTGGDCTNSFNISTASAVVAASCGLKVSKHSNFSQTSLCGSSNVLQSLRINLAKTSLEAVEELQKNNITFLHAPYFHKSTAHVNPVRKELGIRTVFNYLGPLTNPTAPYGQVVGVSSKDLCPKIVEALKYLGCKKSMVVCGENPIIDEISICGKTLVYKLENNNIESFSIHPGDFEIKQAKIEDLAGGTPDENAKIIKDIFSGKITGAKLDAVAINVAAILWSGNFANSLEHGLKIAYEQINKQKALSQLDLLIAK